MKLVHTVKLVALTSLYFLVGAAWAASSGSIDQLSGTVTVTDANKVARKAGPKDPVSRATRSPPEPRASGDQACRRIGGCPASEYAVHLH